MQTVFYNKGKRFNCDLLKALRDSYTQLHGVV